MMIWHVFRKDLRLLWPLICMVGLLQFACAGTRLALGPFGDPPQLAFIADLLTGAMFLAAAMLIITVVHQDTVPGVNQDWLVRPIRRRDLMLAKLLFLLLAVQAPMFAADAVRAALSGLPAAEAMAAAAERSVVLFLTFSLPIAAIAAVTTTAVEAIAGVLAIWLIVLAALIAGSAVRGGAPAFAGTGMQWMIPAYWSVLALGAAALVIPLQYFRRSTARSRRIVVGAVVLAPLLSYSSWASAFSFQQWFSPHPADARSIAISFDPGLGRASQQDPRQPGGAVWLPLRISGLAPGSIVRTDRAIVRLEGTDGQTLFVGPTVDPASPVDPLARTAAGGAVRTYQLIVFPPDVLQALQDRPLRMELTYSLTLLRLDAADTIPAMNGSKRMNGFGSCRTRSDAEGDDVVVGCLKAGRVPDCVAGTLRSRLSGQRNPEDYLCRPDYSPVALPYLDPVRQFDGELAFRDPKGLATYPVGAGQLGHADVVLESYRPRAYFTRRLEIAGVRLRDWRARRAAALTR